MAQQKPKSLKQLSNIMRQSAKRIAQKTGREFVDWNLLTEKQKTNIMKNLKKYYIMFDIKLSEEEDIKGLPKFYLEGKSI